MTPFLIVIIQKNGRHEFSIYRIHASHFDYINITLFEDNMSCYVLRIVQLRSLFHQYPCVKLLVLLVNRAWSSLHLLSTLKSLHQVWE